MQSAAGSSARVHDLGPELRFFERWTLILFGISLVFHLVSHFMHLGGHAAYPLSRGRDRFYDFTLFSDKFRLLHTAAFWKTGFPIVYPAPCIAFYDFFYGLLRPHEVLAFELFCVLVFVVPALAFGRALTRRGVSAGAAYLFVSVITLLSWPAVLLVDGGNMEVLVWLTLLIGMWAYATGRLWLAAAFFGIGASVKLFPFVLFGLFLSRRQYSKIVFGGAVFVVVSVASLAFVGPTISSAFHGVTYGLDSFKTIYMQHWLRGENGVDHSIFALYKGIAVKVFHHSPGGFTLSLTVYLWVMAIAGLLLYAFRIRHMPLLNQVLLLVIASIYFTAFSGDGTLIHLYYPAAMLFLLALQSWRDGVKVPGLHLALGCLVFILSFESFLIHHEQRYIGPAHCIGIAVLFVTGLVFPFGPPLGETISEQILSRPETGWVRRESGALGSGALGTPPRLSVF